MKKLIFVIVILIATISWIVCYKKTSQTTVNNVYEHTINTNDEQIVQNTQALLLKVEGLSFEAYEGMGHNELAICYGNGFKEYLNLFHADCVPEYNMMKKYILTQNKHYLKQISTKCQNIDTTEEECNIILTHKIKWILNNLKTANLELNDKQYEALISLVYNLKNNFNAFVNSNLYQYLTTWNLYQIAGYNTDDFSTYTYNIINEWLDFSRVQGEITCSLVHRRAKEIVIYYSKHSAKEKEIAYNTLHNILTEMYSGCDFVDKY